MRSLPPGQRRAWDLLRKRWKIFASLLLASWLLWPVHLSTDPLSTILLDSGDGLLEARLAADGQWRFPAIDQVPPKMEKAILTFEDRWFYWHPGFNPISLFHAFRSNLKAGRIVRGGSTISMQLIRLARKGQPRTYREKIIEWATAVRLTVQYRKSTVLKEYLSRAPFGGNVVGLASASWRYFRKAPHLLSWGEAAMLAVLPNDPALIHPGRNRDLLRAKRDRLLDQMVAEGYLSTADGILAKSEPLPVRPAPLPRRAPELMTSLGQSEAPLIRTTVNGPLQDAVRSYLEIYQDRMAGNGVFNMAVVIASNQHHQVEVYAGNNPLALHHQGDVDMIPARRSPGSTLKPLLYASALDDGLIWPGSLLPDVPTQYGSYRPENYNRQYEGVVNAEEAIASSLNVPMVRLLKDYGTDAFLEQLRQFGLSTLDRPADHYGLSLILGGGEVSLWDLVTIYSACAHRLQTGHPSTNPVEGLRIRRDLNKTSSTVRVPGIGAIWHMLQAMVLPDRPEGMENWAYFESPRQVAWKTGTSFGFKDAWAIGVTPEYTVGVWVGNADGTPRPDLVGYKAAAPLLFAVFDMLPPTTWFKPPLDDLDYREVCSFSGNPPSGLCPADTQLILIRQQRPPVCTIHREILVDPQTGARVNSSCALPDQSLRRVVEVLPPLQEHYYRFHHPEYRGLPELAPGCLEQQSFNPLQWIYPAEDTRIIIPVDLNGVRQAVLLQATHRDPDAQVFWHCNDQYLGKTRGRHTWIATLPPGTHTLTIMDDSGNRKTHRVEVQE